MACLGVSEVVGSGRKQETSVTNMIAKNGNVKMARATLKLFSSALAHEQELNFGSQLRAKLSCDNTTWCWLVMEMIRMQICWWYWSRG